MTETTQNDRTDRQKQHRMTDRHRMTEQTNRNNKHTE